MSVFLFVDAIKLIAYYMVLDRREFGTDTPFSAYYIMGDEIWLTLRGWRVRFASMSFKATKCTGPRQSRAFDQP